LSLFATVPSSLQFLHPKLFGNLDPVNQYHNTHEISSNKMKNNASLAIGFVISDWEQNFRKHSRHHTQITLHIH
jgi:hypothetical protein